MEASSSITRIRRAVFCFLDDSDCGSEALALNEGFQLPERDGAGGRTVNYRSEHVRQLPLCACLRQPSAERDSSRFLKEQTAGYESEYCRPFSPAGLL